MKHWYPRLRVQLLLLALLVIVPALVLIVLDQRDERQASHDRAIAAMVEVAHATADRQTSVFTGVARHLLTLSQFPAVRAADPTECNALFTQILRERANYNGLWIENPDGSQFCGGHAAAGAVTSARDRSWFTRVTRTRSMALGDFQLGSVTGKPSIALAYPLLAPSGDVFRIIAAAMSVDQMNRGAAQWDLPPGATVTLADQHRTIIVRHPDPVGWVGKALPPSLGQPHLAAGAREQIVDTSGADGIRRLYTMVPIRTGDGTNPMYLAVGIPPASAFVQSNHMLRRQLLLLAFVSLLAMATAWLGGELFVHRPVQTLKAVTSQIAAGHFGARTQLAGGARGLADLGSAINAMAVALETHQHQRDEADAALQASESRYRFLFDQNPYPMWVFDAQTLRFLEVNEAATLHYGYTREEFSTMRITDIQPPEDVPRLTSQMQLERPFGWSHAGSWRHLTKANGTIDVQVTNHPLTFGGNDAVLVIAQDVTRRKRAEESLRTAEERLRFALAAARVGVWEANLQTGVVYWSETCETMHGLAAGTFASNFDAFIACIHPDDRQAVRGAIDQSIAARRKTDFEYRTVWPDGTERRIAVTSDYVYDKDGQPVRAAGVARDITDRRSLEDQLRQSQKMDAIGQLAGGIAHDFNNILVAIIGNASFVREDLTDDDPRRGDLDEVIRSAERAAALTHQLLAFSRKQVLAPQVIHLGTVVANVVPMLRRLLGENVQLTTMLTDHDRLTADPGQLEQVLLNLVINARDAMPDGGCLTIETRDVELDDEAAGERPSLRAGCHVVLAVSDNGHGMDAGTAAKVFEPFFTTKPKGHGTGLGLATVYGIVKQSGGAISLRSALGQGTTFEIYFPRTTTRAQVTPAGAEASQRSGHEAILLIEDEEPVRTLIRRALTKKGYTVTAAGTAREALEHCANHDDGVDLILTDVVLPGENGPSVVKRLMEVHPEARVLYMSGYTDDTVIRHGLMGASLAFIQKPFDLDALLKKIREVLDTARDGAGAG